MTRAEDLLQALNALRRAAGAELSGEAREAALQRIKGLFQLAGFDGEDTGEDVDEALVPLAHAISDVRAQAEGELSGNAFQRAATSLDDIAALSGATEPVLEQSDLGHVDQPEQTAPPVESFGPAFDALSQASKARVEDVAASLGIQTVHHHASPLHAKHYEAPEEYHETPAAEEAVNAGPPSATEETPASAEVIEPQSAREVAEATHDFGTPALATGEVSEYAPPHKEESETAHDFGAPALAPGEVPEYAPAHKDEIETAHEFGTPEHAPLHKEEAEPPVEASALKPAASAPEVSADEPAASSSASFGSAASPKVATAQRIEPLSNEPLSKENHEHPEKTFFSLWLDMLFGRKK